MQATSVGQRDFFDFGNVSALFAEMITDQAMTPGLTARIQRVAQGTLEGWYPAGTAPIPLW